MFRKVRRVAGAALVAAVPLSVTPPAVKAPPAVVYVPGATAYMAGPGVQGAEWSPDGRYVLLTLPSYKSAGPDFRLVLWSRRTGRTALDWTPPWPDAKLGEIVWFAGGHTALAFILATGTEPDASGALQATQRLHVVQLDAVKRSAVERAIPGDPLIAWGNPSPTKPLILLSEGGITTSRIWLLTPDAVGAPVDVPERLDGSVWSPDGATPIFLSFPSRKTTFTQYEPASGRWTLLPKRPPTYRRPKPPFQIVRKATQIRNGDGRAALTHPIWIVSGQGKGAISELLCADGDKAEANQQGDAALYRSKGLAFIRNVAAVSGAEYLTRQREADTEKANEDAKEIGLAMRMYADDYDSALPMNANGMEQVTPYLGGDDALLGPGGLPGFQYTFGGGPLDPSLGPAGTVLGFTTAPGGRFDVYADGHVQWVPNP
jgi:hypothetical protein